MGPLKTKSTPRPGGLSYLDQPGALIGPIFSNNVKKKKPSQKRAAKKLSITKHKQFVRDVRKIAKELDQPRVAASACKQDIQSL